VHFGVGSIAAQYGKAGTWTPAARTVWRSRLLLINSRRRNPLSDSSEKALEACARRAANAGLIACKSRWRRNSIDNYGQFQLVDPYSS